jgi:hypothetical protein
MCKFDMDMPGTDINCGWNFVRRETFRLQGCPWDVLLRARIRLHIRPGCQVPPALKSTSITHRDHNSPCNKGVILQNIAMKRAIM